MMSSDQESTSLAAIQASLQRMEERLSSVCNDVESLKKAKQPVAQLPYIIENTGTVHSTPAQSAVNTPVIGDVVDDEVVAGLSWGERMELEDDPEDPAGNVTSEKPEGDEVHLTQVHESTEEFLRKTFIPVNNAERRQLKQRYIVPDTPFTTSPRLDKVMAAECSKSTKSADLQLSRIQALFLDAVGPLSGLIDGINKGTEVTVDDVEGAVKAALTFLGNASSQCTSLRRVGILEEYNKDLISFCQESQDLFASTSGMLFGSSFAEKASEHLKQIQTLRQAKGANRSNQGFSKAPPPALCSAGGQVLHSATTAAILQRSTEKRRTTAKLSKEMTRTFKCTHSFNIKRMCKPYDSPPNTSGLRKATGSTAVKSSGWEAVSLCNQLGGANNRQMGNTGSERISNSFHQSTSSGALAKPSYVLSRAKPANTRGSEYTVRKKGCCSDKQPSTSGEFLFHTLPGPQERGPDEASDKPQEVKRMGNTPTLQDGRHGDPQRVAEDKRLDGEGRLKRCLLHSSNTSQPSPIPEVHGGTRALSVHMPAIRPVLCPMGFHQSDEANSNFPPQHGSAHDSLYRRHTPDGGLPRSSGVPLGNPDIPTNKSGVYYQCSQVNNDTNPGDRIPGPTSELNNTTSKVARRETPPYQVGGKSNPPEITCDSPAAGTDNRETECSFTGSATCSVVLPVPTRRPTESLEGQQSELQGSPVTISASSRRALLVAREIGTLEWQSPASPPGNCGHRVRCISAGFGSSVQWHQDRRSLESVGETNAHKLLGIVGSNLSTEILCKGSNRDSSTTTAGQSNSCSIYQQHGGYSVTPVDRSDKSPVDVGSIQRYCTVCRVHSRVNELHC